MGLLDEPDYLIIYIKYEYDVGMIRIGNREACGSHGPIILNIIL